MSSDRRKVLEMLAEGKITPEEADRLLGKLERSGETPGADEGPDTAGGKRPVKYLRVLVNGNAGDKVNIRLPIALVRTGLMLSTMIPVAASDELRRRGVDLSGLSALQGEELIDALRDINVDVESADGGTVRVFCE